MLAADQRRGDRHEQLVDQVAARAAGRAATGRPRRARCGLRQRRSGRAAPRGRRRPGRRRRRPARCPRAAQWGRHRPGARAAASVRDRSTAAGRRAAAPTGSRGTTAGVRPDPPHVVARHVPDGVVGRRYRSARAVPAATRTTSVPARSAWNSRRSASLLRPPERPSSEYEPSTLVTMLAITQGRPSAERVAPSTSARTSSTGSTTSECPEGSSCRTAATLATRSSTPRCGRRMQRSARESLRVVVGRDRSGARRVGTAPDRPDPSTGQRRACGQPPRNPHGCPLCPTRSSS